MMIVNQEQTQQKLINKVKKSFNNKYHYKFNNQKNKR